MEQNQKKVQKKRTFSAYITSLAVLSFLLVFTLNLLATRLDIVWDMTPSGMYHARIFYCITKRTQPASFVL